MIKGQSPFLLRQEINSNGIEMQGKFEIMCETDFYAKGL